jgi:hypothetical protein
MLPGQFYSLLHNRFPFQPTVKQDVFFSTDSRFFNQQQKSRANFCFKRLCRNRKNDRFKIVNNLEAINKKYVLLAPTGRARKVIANYSNKEAFTIHKRIYFLRKPKWWSSIYYANQ